MSEESIVTDHDASTDRVYEDVGETSGLANLDTGHGPAHNGPPE